MLNIILIFRMCRERRDNFSFDKLIRRHSAIVLRCTASRPSRIVLFISEENKTPSIPDSLVVSRLIDPHIQRAHYFTTFQSMLTREAYGYWRKVDVVTNQTGSIFDGPPARVKGNIVNGHESAGDVHGTGYESDFPQVLHITG